jgi:hypothetical protein
MKLAQTSSNAIARLDRDGWLHAWTALPESRRSTFLHPDFVIASAHWEGGEGECLHIVDGDRSLLYPYVRHAIPDASAGSFDIQTAYGYGGPLFVGEWDHASRVDALREIGQHLVERGGVAEFVRCHERWTDFEVLRDAGYATPVVRTNVTCDLSAEPIPSSWAGNVRRNLKRAMAVGLRWRLGTTADDLESFIRIYTMTAARLDMAASYRFDDDYFRSLFAMSRPLTQFVLVENSNGATVAAALVIHGGELAHYHLGGSDLAHQADRPNDLLYLGMAGAARSAGCRYMAWGGGLSTDPTDTLLRFKSGFGQIQTPARIGCRVLNAHAYQGLVGAWERRNPERAATCKMFLRYRAA